MIRGFGFVCLLVVVMAIAAQSTWVQVNFLGGIAALMRPADEGKSPAVIVTEPEERHDRRRDERFEPAAEVVPPARPAWVETLSPGTAYPLHVYRSKDGRLCFSVPEGANMRGLYCQ
jgi:hypothetical protein